MSYICIEIHTEFVMYTLNRFEKFDNYFLTFVIFTEYIIKRNKPFNTSSWM